MNCVMIVEQVQFQGSVCGDLPPKTYESNFIHHNFLQFGEEHSWYKAILSSIILSQQCCEQGCGVGGFWVESDS